MLWIAFDLYLWKIEHSTSLLREQTLTVVNCFRFVSLKDWTQQKLSLDDIDACCELLSICIFERLNTAHQKKSCSLRTLWIAFDLYLWKIEHSVLFLLVCPKRVVNCFRFVSLKDWTQLHPFGYVRKNSCELLSICIFERLNTAVIHQPDKVATVVNCFRFVSLKDWTQQFTAAAKLVLRCELLSICIFERLNTAKAVVRFSRIMLWIAFDLYLWKIEHSLSSITTIIKVVVNCFRFVSLKDWTQHLCKYMGFSQSCELLSICIFERLNTADTKNFISECLLWIAFDLYLWKIEHSMCLKMCCMVIVVNCFRFVSLKDWTQQLPRNVCHTGRCELLSICIFERLNTAMGFSRKSSQQLWIAFDLYLWKIEHSFWALLE